MPSTTADAIAPVAITRRDSTGVGGFRLLGLAGVVVGGGSIEVVVAAGVATGGGPIGAADDGGSIAAATAGGGATISVVVVAVVAANAVVVAGAAATGAVVDVAMAGGATATGAAVDDGGVASTAAVGASSLNITCVGLTKRPWSGFESKYFTPLTEPSFLPAASVHARTHTHTHTTPKSHAEPHKTALRATTNDGRTTTMHNTRFDFALAMSSSIPTQTPAANFVAPTKRIVPISARS